MTVPVELLQGQLLHRLLLRRRAGLVEQVELEYCYLKEQMVETVQLVQLIFPELLVFPEFLVLQDVLALRVAQALPVSRVVRQEPLVVPVSPAGCLTVFVRVLVFDFQELLAFQVRQVQLVLSV